MIYVNYVSLRMQYARDHAPLLNQNNYVIGEIIFNQPDLLLNYFHRCRCAALMEFTITPFTFFLTLLAPDLHVDNKEAVPLLYNSRNIMSQTDFHCSITIY